MVYIIIYYFMVVEGRKAYLFFSSIKEGVGGYEDDIMQVQLSTQENSKSGVGSATDSKSEFSVEEVYQVFPSHILF